MILKNILSKQDAINLLELIHSSLSCNEEDDMRELIKRLNFLIPYDFATCLLAQRELKGMIKSYEVINVNYPDEWIELYTTKKYHQIDPIIKENFCKFSLQYWADTYKLNTPQKEFLSLAEDFRLKDGYTHGVRDLKGTKGSLFSFSGNSIECHKRTEVILEYIIPHFHLALVRVAGQRDVKSGTLSSREKEILLWIKKGKNTWDISQIIGISERTVKFHVKNILQKLDAVNRPQAVAIAIEQGLIEIE